MEAVERIADERVAAVLRAGAVAVGVDASRTRAVDDAVRLER